MTTTSKITLAVLGDIIVALVGGYFAAGSRGGSSASAADSGAFLLKTKDRGECGWVWPWCRNDDHAARWHARWG
jgi:hypothetical protein